MKVFVCLSVLNMDIMEGLYRRHEILLKKMYEQQAQYGCRTGPRLYSINHRAPYVFLDPYTSRVMDSSRN